MPTSACVICIRVTCYTVKPEFPKMVLFMDLVGTDKIFFCFLTNTKINKSFLTEQNQAEIIIDLIISSILELYF